MAIFQAVMPSDGIAAQPATCMDEESFRLFYERTARPLGAYLCRVLGDVSKADDVLQESYLHLLEAKMPPAMTDEHRKNYLFRIAANLLRNEYAKRKPEPLADYASGQELAHDTARKQDMQCFLEQLNPRQRELLWLAYVECFTHEEIAAAVGAKTPSIRPMLARARSKLSEILKAAGFVSSGEAR